eukprot:CAMPEP_0173078100 /NCGR_PEP_ID=MMETSP1102-20130122/13827_1 /TAXON_ID=49646 /ORGANISM="Geminigera sp., Strain Caron Lab Isolate" /LENGTH=44 /DNA_ID= /DNA_START= /DNA_END= /DNA_ORIENTATION=
MTNSSQCSVAKVYFDRDHHGILLRARLDKRAAPLKKVKSLNMAP